MPEPAILIRGLSYTYSDGARALDGISLSIAPGESAALIGHNGSGKSTLLMHLVGILEPDPRVMIGGVPLARKTLPAIRRKVGFVFQNPRDQLFMSTVIEDVAFGPLNLGLDHHEALHRAEHALVDVGLADFGSRVSYHLSGGEMRRAAIATVLSMSPEIVVMDEPSSGLDPRAARDLASLIRQLPVTRLISSHDLDFVRACCDRVILLNKGKVAADGPAKDILDNREFLERNGL